MPDPIDLAQDAEVSERDAALSAHAAAAGGGIVVGTLGVGHGVGSFLALQANHNEVWSWLVMIQRWRMLATFTW